MATTFEESLLREVAEAARDARLEMILIGNAAAALHGAPVTTRDIDFFLRDTPANARKVERLAERLGGLAITRPGAPLSNTIRLVGKPAEIDLVFSLSSGARFESVRSRAIGIRLGAALVQVASLEDVIARTPRVRRAAKRRLHPLVGQSL